MRDDFAIFILSHGRAETMTTFDFLRRKGYSGKLFIVVDDEDEQKNMYKQIYGEEVVKIFCKKEYFEKVDTYSIDGNTKSVVFARNAAYDIADVLGITYFCEFDDDLTDVAIRYIDGNKLKSKSDYNFDDLCNAMLELLQCDKVWALSFGQAFNYIGGINGRFKSRLERQAFGFYFLKTTHRIHYKGITNEDMNTILELGQQGKVTFSVLDFMAASPERTTNEGGNFELYNSMTKYVRNFYPLITAPSCVKMKSNGEIERKQNSMFPKILSERWKKYA